MSNVRQKLHIHTNWKMGVQVFIARIRFWFIFGPHRRNVYAGHGLYLLAICVCLFGKSPPLGYHRDNESSLFSGREKREQTKNQSSSNNRRFEQTPETRPMKHLNFVCFTINQSVPGIYETLLKTWVPKLKDGFKLSACAKGNSLLLWSNALHDIYTVCPLMDLVVYL